MCGREAVDRRADHAERLPNCVVRSRVAGPQYARRGDCRQDAQYHDDNHELDKRKTSRSAEPRRTLGSWPRTSTWWPGIVDERKTSISAARQSSPTSEPKRALGDSPSGSACRRNEAESAIMIWAQPAHSSAL